MIKAGDLVQVVKLPSCGCSQMMKQVFQVTEFNNFSNPFCIHCGLLRERCEAAYSEVGKFSIEVYRLKRIFPLDETETVTEKETLYA